MSRINEVKIGDRFHYVRDPQSGFWISKLQTDKMSATITSFELATIIKDNVTHGQEFAKKILERTVELAQIAVELSNEGN